MRIKDLITEAPIDQFQTFNMDNVGTFSAQDKRTINSPERIQRVKRFFENTPFVFDLFFVNIDLERDEDYLRMMHFDQKSAQYPTGKIVSKKEILDDLGIDININQNAISVVYLSNYADSSFPLTPWMIAHRFTHTILEDAPDMPISADDPSLQAAIEIFQSTVRHFLKIAIEKKGLIDFSEFLTMKTARNKELRLDYSGKRYEIEEISQEFLTEFIIKGKIGFKIPDNIPQAVIGITLIKEFKAAIDQINAAAKPLLKACVGKILVMP